VKAATNIQASFRGFLDRKKVKELKAEAADLKRYLALQKDRAIEGNDNLEEVLKQINDYTFSENVPFIENDRSNFDNDTTIKRAAKTTDDLPQQKKKNLDELYLDEEKNAQTKQIFEDIPKTLAAIFPHQPSKEIAKIAEHGLADTSTKSAKIVITKEAYQIVTGLLQQIPNIQDILKHNSPEVNESLLQIANYFSKEASEDLVLTKEFPHFSEIQQLLQNTLSLAQYSLADDKQKSIILKNSPIATSSVSTQTESQQVQSTTQATKLQLNLDKNHKTFFAQYATEEAATRYLNEVSLDNKNIAKANKLASWGAKQFIEKISQTELANQFDSHNKARENVIKKTTAEIKKISIEGKKAKNSITFPLANNLNLIFTTDKDGFKTFNLDELINAKADVSIAIPTKDKKSHDIIEIRNGQILSLVFSHLGESQLARSMQEQLKTTKNQEHSK
jgi:hypothetical protein